MCGRYAFYLEPSKLQSLLGLENLINFPARYNCAPCQELPIVVKGRMGFARWGFRPSWARDDNAGMAAKMINARSESVSEKPAFRDTWAAGKRCIIPANGFYEWKKVDGNVQGKQPFFIHDKGGGLLYMAGLWSKVDGQVSFTILTKDADGDIAKCHHRMPVMLEAGQTGDWFSADVDEAHAMIEKATGLSCEFYPVSSDVGKVSNDHADLVEKIFA